MWNGAKEMAQVKSTGCYCRRPGFDSQYPYDDSQPSVIPVLRDPRPPPTCKSTACTLCSDIHAGKTLSHTQQIIRTKFRGPKVEAKKATGKNHNSFCEDYSKQ